MSLIPCQRDLFEIPAEVAYFDCAKMSPLLRSAREAGERGLGRKTRPWDIRACDFFDEAERVRALAGRLIGAGADDVAIVPAASYGLATAAANVRVAPGQRIVLPADDFPSSFHTFRALVEENGAELVSVASPEGGDWTAAILDAIDERTALACVPHVHWMCGSLFDLVAIGRRCRSVGAALVLDLTQSLGALPFDLAAVDPDYLVAASYKWLLGPYSLGFLYVAPRRQDGRPLEQNWIARAGAEDFRRLTAYEPRYAAGARRFDMGERSNFALLPVSGAAIEQLLRWGVADIAETLGHRTAAIAARLAPAGITAMPPERRAPHFLSVRLPGGIDDSLAERLAAAHVHVSLRGEGMRITPHLYNDDDDADRLTAALTREDVHA